MKVFGICIEAIVNATHAFAHLIEQVPGSQRRHGEFLGLVIPVHTNSTQGEVNDDERFFACRAAMLSDDFRLDGLMCGLHQS